MKKPLSTQTFAIFWRSLGLSCLLAILIRVAYTLKQRDQNLGSA